MLTPMATMNNATRATPYSHSAPGRYLKFIPKNPVMKLSGRKIMEMMVRTASPDLICWMLPRGTRRKDRHDIPIGICEIGHSDEMIIDIGIFEINPDGPLLLTKAVAKFLDRELLYCRSAQ